jgi:hypothetical protein
MELRIADEAARIQRETLKTAEESLRIAKEKVGLEERAAKAGDGEKRKKIMGFSRKRAGLKAFGGLDELSGMNMLKEYGADVGERFKGKNGGQLRTGKGFRSPGETFRRFGITNPDLLGRYGLTKPPGIKPPGVASRAQQRKDAEAAAAKAVEPRWDLVEAIDQKLSGLGLV